MPSAGGGACNGRPGEPEQAEGDGLLRPDARRVPSGGGWSATSATMTAARSRRARRRGPIRHILRAAGVAGMDLFDPVEMVCDRMAAAERQPDDGVRLARDVALFGIEPQLA